MDNIISIIVPVFNVAKTIEKTCNSIINQNYRELEIILVNDGSTDNSERIIEALAKKDKRIRTIHQKNCGVTGARITGIMAATGRWIGFADGDDYIEPDMYERLISNAIKCDAQISHCGYQMVFPSRVDYYYNTKRTIIQNREQGLSALISGDYIEPALVNKIYRAEIVKRVINEGLMDYSIKINEDLLMNYYLFKLAKKSIFEDFCPYHYMLREGSAATSRVNINKLYDPIKVQKIILEDVGDNEVLSDIIYGRLASIYINGASMKSGKEESFVKNYIHECKVELKRIKPFFFRSKRNTFEKFKFNLCLFSPSLYRLFHTTYAKIKGTDKKYEVN